jgi:hypothetical protein
MWRHNAASLGDAVAAGWAGPGLLDTYEAERRPVAQTNVDYSAGRGSGLLRMREAIGRGDLDAVRDGLAARSSAGSRRGQDLGYTYDSSAVVPDGTELPDVKDRMRDYVQNARPGSRAPHLWVERAGRGMSTLDLFGTGFVLITGQEGGRWVSAAQDVCGSSGLPLKAVTVGSDGDLQADSTRWQEPYGVGPDGAVLVRPDGFVGWRSPEMRPDPRAELSRAVGQIIARAI